MKYKVIVKIYSLVRYAQPKTRPMALTKKKYVSDKFCLIGKYFSAICLQPCSDGQDSSCKEIVLL